MWVKIKQQLDDLSHRYHCCLRMHCTFSKGYTDNGVRSVSEFYAPYERLDVPNEKRRKLGVITRRLRGSNSTIVEPALAIFSDPVIRAL